MIPMSIASQAMAISSALPEATGPNERLAGNHPAPCARSCEANAYEIQIRQLSAERDALAAKLAELEGQKPALYVQSDHVRHAKFSPFLGRICQQPFDGISQIAYYARSDALEQVRAEERDELFPPPGEQMAVEWAAGTVACANAIRARGKK